MPDSKLTGAALRTPAQGHVPVRGASLYYREMGQGPPIVVLHGGPDFNHNYLLPELDRLTETLRVIHYDQRGRGKSSDRVAPDTVTIDSEIADLDELRQYFGLDTIVLLGHSWGCVLAMEYAIRHRDRVSHLILMNPAPASYADRLLFQKRRETDEAPALARMRAIAGASHYARGDIETEREYYRLHFSGAFFGSNHLETVLGRLRTHFTPDTIVKARLIEDRLYAQTWRLPDYDLLPQLGGVDRPVLVISGDHDFVPVACARHIAEAVPDARFALLENCGHFACLERPDEVVATISDFLGAPKDVCSRRWNTHAHSTAKRHARKV